MNQVTVSLYGGLGNQLFQYAAGFSLAKRTGAELVFDLSWFDASKLNKNITPRDFALEPFRLGVSRKKNAYTTYSRAIALLRKVFIKPPVCLETYNEKGYEFNSEFLSLDGSIHLNGYWQSYKYFQQYQSELRSKIGSPKLLNKHNADMIETITGTESICLHIRRGDYVTNPTANATHGLCDLKYYKQGLEKITSGLSMPHCYVFSDDTLWVRQNLDISIPFTVVDINSSDEAHLDLWLMAACKHFVIANSSLSWWGAWLSKHKNKVVVAPQNWFVSKDKNTEDLIPEDWIRI